MSVFSLLDRIAAPSCPKSRSLVDVLQTRADNSRAMVHTIQTRRAECKTAYRAAVALDHARKGKIHMRAGKCGLHRAERNDKGSRYRRECNVKRAGAGGGGLLRRLRGAIRQLIAATRSLAHDRFCLLRLALADGAEA